VNKKSNKRKMHIYTLVRKLLMFTASVTGESAEMCSETTGNKRKRVTQSVENMDVYCALFFVNNYTEPGSHAYVVPKSCIRKEDAEAIRILAVNYNDDYKELEASEDDCWAFAILEDRFGHLPSTEEMRKAYEKRWGEAYYARAPWDRWVVEPGEWKRARKITALYMLNLICHSSC